MEKPKFPIRALIIYPLLLSIIGMIFAFFLYLIIGFIGVFTGEKYDPKVFRKFFGYAGFLIPMFIILWRFYLSNKKYSNYLKIDTIDSNRLGNMSKEELEVELRLSKEFMEELEKIDEMMNHSDQTIQRQGERAHRRLAEKVIKKHKQGKPTGVEPSFLKHLIEVYPDLF
jgi:hypothetical protein